MNTENALTKEQLSQLVEVAAIINSSLDPNQVLEKVMDLTNKILEVEASSLLLVDEPGNRLFFKTATGERQKEMAQFTLKLGEGIAGTVAKTGETVLVNDVTKDPHFRKDISESIDFPTKSILCVPLKLKEKVIGVIEVINKISGSFSENDIQLLLGIAQQAAIAIDNARMHQALGKEYEQLKDVLHLSPEFVGKKSSGAKTVLELIEKVSPTDSTLLITGETGVGKEIIARKIHEKSKRKSYPFTCVTCAILTETLLESELFGHEKGAFTGATTKKIGKFELAHRGIVFLDEISAIPLPTQIKLLRVLQEREFERVGGNHLINVDIRILAASNEDLPTLIKEGKFREDLYYRLKVIEIPVPALRDRQEDIPELAKYYLKLYSEEIGRTIDKIAPPAMELLLNYTWPGNIRELKNVIERAVVLGSGDTLLPDHLPTEIIHGRPAVVNNEEASTEWSLETVEKWHIDRVLANTSGNKSKAAKILGISRNRLDRKLKI